MQKAHLYEAISVVNQGIDDELKERKEARKKKGLPPRAFLLPDRDKDDEERPKERHTKRSKSNRSELKLTSGKRADRRESRGSAARGRRAKS